MKENVPLNVKEQKRLLVLNEILAGRMTGQEVAEVMRLSPYQITPLIWLHHFLFIMITFVIVAQVFNTFRLAKLGYNKS